jgi:hypothetical protein
MHADSEKIAALFLSQEKRRLEKAKRNYMPHGEGNYKSTALQILIAHAAKKMDRTRFCKLLFALPRRQSVKKVQK